VISLERAIALGKPFGYGSPLAAGLGAVLILLGLREAGLVVELVAPLFLLAVGIDLVRRQPLTHIVLLLVASACWLVGNALNLAGAAPNACAAWWFAFLVLTIAAERLEMTRLMQRPPIAARLFHAAVAIVLAGALSQTLFPEAGGIVFGAGLVALAAWCAAFDLARRTVLTEGFSRYAAVALLAGYAWLAVGGFAWGMMSTVSPAWRDAALHSLGLGFVFSMILAHAPVVVPVVTRRRMRYTPFFYVPLALLHASLVARLAGGPGAFRLREAGGILNAVALLVFVGTLAYALSRTSATGTRPTTTSEEPWR
ncbi:MAG TPA: NnrS family protein, partial [Usitatibacter sp.]|nr:NnrS family protein [Usitatibacter sp.]